MELIMNADDFGYTKSVTDGIVEAYRIGIIRSTTAMCNMHYIEYAGARSKEVGGLGIGIHLTLTCGEPILKTHKTIVDENNVFYKKSKILREKENLDCEEIYQEMKAQMEKFIQVFERKPTHIDGHHGCIMYDSIWPATKRIADEYGLRIRRTMEPNIYYYDYFYADKANFEHLKLVLEDYCKRGVPALEIGCHPAFVDLDLFHDSSYNVQRIQELACLTSPETLQLIKDLNIHLTNYNEI